MTSAQITVQDAAHRLGVTEQYVYKLIRLQKLKGGAVKKPYKRLKDWWVDAKDVRRFIRDRARRTAV